MSYEIALCFWLLQSLEHRGRISLKELVQNVLALYRFGYFVKDRAS